MKVAGFSTKSYDKEYLDRFNTDNKQELSYFEALLNTNTALPAGYNCVWLFVNDKANKETREKLSADGIKLIA